MQTLYTTIRKVSDTIQIRPFSLGFQMNIGSAHSPDTSCRTRIYTVMENIQQIFKRIKYSGVIHQVYNTQPMRWFFVLVFFLPNFIYDKAKMCHVKIH